MTVNSIDDPSDLVGLDVGNSYENYPQPPPTGERNVAANVTIENEGSVVLPGFQEGDPGVLTLAWALNPTSASPDGSYFEGGLPSESCHGEARPDTTSLDKGQSVTGCYLFLDIPDTVPIASVAGWVEFAGANQIPTRWIVE